MAFIRVQKVLFLEGHSTNNWVDPKPSFGLRRIGARVSIFRPDPPKYHWLGKSKVQWGIAEDATRWCIIDVWITNPNLLHFAAPAIGHDPGCSADSRRKETGQLVYCIREAELRF